MPLQGVIWVGQDQEPVSSYIPLCLRKKMCEAGMLSWVNIVEFGAFSYFEATKMMHKLTCKLSELISCNCFRWVVPMVDHHAQEDDKQGQCFKLLYKTWRLPPNPININQLLQCLLKAFPLHTAWGMLLLPFYQKRLFVARVVLDLVFSSVHPSSFLFWLHGNCRT